jgi:hypothetical protein
VLTKAPLTLGRTAAFYWRRQGRDIGLIVLASRQPLHVVLSISSARSSALNDAAHITSRVAGRCGESSNQNDATGAFFRRADPS